VRQETRAKLILAGLGAVHTDLVVGERDLSLGLPFLTAAAAEAKVRLLSANLRDASGKAPFEGHVVVSAGGLKVCVVAISQPNGYPEGIHAEDPVEAARQELQKLPASGCDLKMLLAHLVRTDLDRVLKEAPGFDLAAVAHEGWQGPPQSSSGIPVVYVGQRGRTLFRLDLESAGGSEPLVDLGAIERARQESESLDRRIEDTKKQIASAKDPSAYKATLQALERRRKETGDARKKDTAYHPRVFHAEAVDLGTGVSDDPEVQKLVQAYLAKYPADAADRPPPPPTPMIGPNLPPRSGKLPAGMFPATPPPAMLHRPAGPPPALPPAAFPPPAPAHTAP